MTKYLSVLLFLLSAIAVGAQPTWPPVGEEGVDFNLRNSKGKKTGLWYRTYSDGGLYYAGEFENDRPKPGTSLYYYYENGHPMATHKFRPDAITVDAKHYYSSGILQSQGKYVEQKKDSTWKFYDEKGLLRSIENYKEDSLHGKKEIFYPGGQLLKEEIYDFGTPIGKFTEYYDNGNPRTVGHWEAGKFGGDFIYYYSNGKKESEGKFANDLRDGQWLYWLKDGQLQAQVLYRAGKIVKEVIQNGERVEYYPSGIPKLECNYKNGVLHGIYTEYYDQGEWVREQVMDPAPGAIMEFKEKLINQQPSKECEYVNGKLKGEVLYYSPNGELLKTELYENGELIESDSE